MKADRDQRRRERERPRRGVLTALLVALLLLAGGLAAGARYYSKCQHPPGGPPTKVPFTVEQGATGKDVMGSLHDAGLVSCEGFVMDLFLRGSGKADGILAGTYELTRGSTLDEILRVLTTPPKEIPTVRVTIPEGYRLTQIADRVHEDVGIPVAAFTAALDRPDVALPPYLPASAASPEGFLFPATYDVPKGETQPGVVIRMMLRAFQREAADLHLEAGAKRLDLTPYEVVTVASMIEKEARVERDRKLIASVIYNRLRDGMTLGIDATLLYDDPTPDGSLSDADLASDSPYNTRLHTGLPPTPIASPGEHSLEAALHPARTNYFYYVLCGADGSHRFATTYAEHLRNVNACLG